MWEQKLCVDVVLIIIMFMDNAKMIVDEIRTESRLTDMFNVEID